MALTDPSLRRLKPVRLTDIPLEERLKAAHRLLKGCRDGHEAQTILLAAISPSNQTYYITFDKAA